MRPIGQFCTLQRADTEGTEADQNGGDARLGSKSVPISDRDGYCLVVWYPLAALCRYLVGNGEAAHGSRRPGLGRTLVPDKGTYAPAAPPASEFHDFHVTSSSEAHYFNLASMRSLWRRAMRTTEEEGARADGLCV